MNVMALVKTGKLKVVRPSIFVAIPSTFESFTLKQIGLYNPLLYAYWDLPTEKVRNKFGSEAGLRTRQPIKWRVSLFARARKTIRPIRCRVQVSSLEYMNEKRFVDHDTSVEDHLESRENKNTKEKTKRDVKLLETF